jgi:ribosomal protein S11
MASFNNTIVSITDEKDGIYFIDKSGSAITLKAQGWKHF